MDKFVLKRSAPEKVEPPPPKKVKAATKFNSSHSAAFPCMKPSQKGDTFAFCSVCNVNISVASGGRDDIKKHVEGQKHVSALKDSGSSSMQKVSTFFSRGDDMSAIRAEVLWTQFVMDKGLPLRASEDFGKLLKQMCPDSEIAKKFACGRTKTRAIAECISGEITSQLVTRMKLFPFSMGTDGSNDHQSKLYPIVITINDESCQEICTELLSVPELTEASTAANISFLLLSELERFKVPLSNCVSFMSDNASVMVGSKGGVSTLLKREQPDMLSLGCGCHLINLAVKKAMSALPLKVDDFLTDIYYFFHHAEKKLLEFNKIQLLCNEEAKKILKHCPTRWLSLSTSLQRVVELWQPLLAYFKQVKEEEEQSAKKRHRTKKPKTHEEVSEQIIGSMFKQSMARASSSKEIESQPNAAHHQSSRLDRLLETLKSKKSLVYCSFLLWIMPVFDKFNKCLQKEEPQVHKLNGLYLSLYREILSKFVQPKAIRAKCPNLTSVDFEDESNHVTDVYIGELALGLMADLKAKSRADITSNIKAFYIASLKYMRDSFPINSDILLHARFVDISKREDCSFADIQFFNKKLPTLKCSMDKLHEELTRLQTSSLPSAVQAEPRCDRQWNMLLQLKCDVDGSFLYANLARLALSVLSIPHSNAAAERIFSLVRKNRSESRSLMSNDTLNTLLVNKVRVTSSTAARPVKLTDEFLRRCKKSTMESLRPTQQQ